MAMSSCLMVTKRYLMKLIYAPGVTPLPLGKTIVLFIILVGILLMDSDSF